MAELCDGRGFNTSTPVWFHQLVKLPQHISFETNELGMLVLDYEQGCLDFDAQLESNIVSKLCSIFKHLVFEIQIITL